MKSVPDEQHATNLAAQEALRLMLRDGFISGPEDNRLIMAILREDFELPIFPIWDPQGILLSDAVTTGGHSFDPVVEKLFRANKRGIFNPKRYSAESDDGKVLHKQLKIMILKRLYPAFRKYNKIEIENFIDDFMKKPSFYDGEPVGNNVFDLYDKGVYHYPYINEKPRLITQ